MQVDARIFVGRAVEQSFQGFHQGMRIAQVGQAAVRLAQGAIDQASAGAHRIATQREHGTRAAHRLA